MGGVSMCKMETWLLEDYAEGVLGVAETAILDAHLSTCADCRKELSHIKLLFWELESMRREPVAIPVAMKAMESAVLDEWLAEKKESLLSKTGNRIASTSRRTAELVEAIPGIKACGSFAEKTAKRTAKLIGRAAKKRLQQTRLFSGGG